MQQPGDGLLLSVVYGRGNFWALWGVRSCPHGGVVLVYGQAILVVPASDPLPAPHLYHISPVALHGRLDSSVGPFAPG